VKPFARAAFIEKIFFMKETNAFEKESSDFQVAHVIQKG
jgi:hypothetical protein